MSNPAKTATVIDLPTQRDALFGIGAPTAKWLGGSIDPVMLTALHYLGSGLSLLTLRLLRAGIGRTDSETPLRCPDLPWLACGIAGPVPLMLEMRSTSGATASLRLAFEGVLIVATALMAITTWAVLRERHAHLRTHEPLKHEHHHEHDTHHPHPHNPEQTAGRSHSRRLRHEAPTHSHTHCLICTTSTDTNVRGVRPSL